MMLNKLSQNMNNTLLILNPQKDIIDNCKSNIYSILNNINILIQNHSSIIIAKKWYPPNHSSFVEMHPSKQIGETIFNGKNEQLLQRQHCVQYTDGSNNTNFLDYSKVDKCFLLGTNCLYNTYSAFHDQNFANSTFLNNWLLNQQIKKITLVGFYLEDMVKNTALDALAFGFDVDLFLDCCGSNNSDNSVLLSELKEAGASLQVLNRTDI